MPRILTKHDYQKLVTQFISAIGIISVQQSLGDAVCERIESVVLTERMFHKAVDALAGIITVEKNSTNEGGTLYQVKIPDFTVDMTEHDKGGFRAVFSNILARSLKFKVTEFSADPIELRAFSLRLLEIKDRAILERIAERSKGLEISR